MLCEILMDTRIAKYKARRHKSCHIPVHILTQRTLQWMLWQATPYLGKLEKEKTKDDSMIRSRHCNIQCMIIYFKLG